MNGLASRRRTMAAKGRRRSTREKKSLSSPPTSESESDDSSSDDDEQIATFCGIFRPEQFGGVYVESSSSIDRLYPTPDHGCVDSIIRDERTALAWTGMSYEYLMYEFSKGYTATIAVFEKIWKFVRASVAKTAADNRVKVIFASPLRAAFPNTMDGYRALRARLTEFQPIYESDVTTGSRDSGTVKISEERGSTKLGIANAEWEKLRAQKSADNDKDDDDDDDGANKDNKRFKPAK